MTRSEIIQMFRDEFPDLPSRVISDTTLNSWCLLADKAFCAITRCIVDQDGTTITTTEDDQYYDLASEITNFYDIDDYPGSGVLYNGKRLTKTTMSALDVESPNWRARDSGTPKKWYRRGKYLYLDRKIDANAEDLIIYSVLLSDDWNTDVAPFNQLSHLEPYHEAIGYYLAERAKGKIAKPEEAVTKGNKFLDYCNWAKKQIGGNISGPIYFRKSV
jgi:hypothetical protein